VVSLLLAGGANTEATDWVRREMGLRDNYGGAELNSTYSLK